MQYLITNSLNSAKALTCRYSLIYTAILYGLTAPVLIAIILHISNNKKVMGNFTNSRFSNILGFSALILMTVAALALLYLQF